MEDAQLQAHENNHTNDRFRTLSARARGTLVFRVTEL